MSVWDVGLILAGALGVGLLIDRLSGGVLQTIITKIVDFLQDMVNFLLNNLPKPIKMAVFLILFVSLGGVLYNYTVGAQYVCLEDSVHKVDITEGIAANLWPPDRRDTLSDRQKAQEANPRLNESTSVGTEDWRITKTSSFISGNTYVPEEDVITDDILYSREDVTFQENGEDIQFDRLVFAVVSRGDIINTLWLNAMFESEQDKYDFFNAWMGGDLQATYEVCRDPATNTCTLARRDTSSWGDIFQYSVGIQDDFADGCEGGPVFGNPSPGLYGEVVGTIGYNIDQDTGQLTGAFTPRELVFGGEFLRQILGQDITDYCQQADEQDRSREEATYEAIIGTVDEPIQADTVRLYNARAGRVQVPLYGLSRVPILADISTGYVYADKTNPDPEADVDLGRDNTVRDLFDDPQPVEEERGDIVTFSCDEESDNEFDTTMYLGGIDVFDPKLMFLVVIISFIWGFYKSVGALD